MSDAKNTARETMYKYAFKCRTCGCLWRLNDPDSVQPEGSWSLWDATQIGGRECCDNVPMTLDPVLPPKAKPESSAHAPTRDSLRRVPVCGKCGYDSVPTDPLVKRCADCIAQAQRIDEAVADFIRMEHPINWQQGHSPWFFDGRRHATEDGAKNAQNEMIAGRQAARDGAK